MAKTSLAFFLLVFILAISEFTTVKGKICEKPSKTWFGACQDTNKCDKQCIDWEEAKHGSCHERENKYMCFCYYTGEECGDKGGGAGGAPPGGAPPPPADGGGSPPPADGGGSPPPADGGGGGGEPPADGGAPPADGGAPPAA